MVPRRSYDFSPPPGVPKATRSFGRASPALPAALPAPSAPKATGSFGRASPALPATLPAPGTGRWRRTARRRVTFCRRVGSFPYDRSR